MIKEKKYTRRKEAHLEILSEVTNLKEKDPFMEVVNINIVCIIGDPLHCVKYSIPWDFYNIRILRFKIDKVFDAFKREYKIDSSLSSIKIIIYKGSKTDKIGEIINIDLTK